VHFRAYKDWRWGATSIHALRFLCRRDKNSIDVGANVGRLTYFMSLLSRRCIAIEPNPFVRSILEAHLGRSVDILPFAVGSEAAGHADLRVPKKNGEPEPLLGTICEDNRLGDLETDVHRVETRSLDALSLSDVGFVKIDVEGYEMAVLEGAEELLGQKPSFLVEAEERHCPGTTGRVSRFFQDRGYYGCFLFRKRLMDIAEFRAAEHQRVENADTRHDYAGDFVFVPERSLIEKMREKASRW
jgi:FkbM family methyltransferase